MTPRPENALDSSGARPRRVSAGNDRLQASCIDRIDRHVRPHGAARGRAQLDLIVGPASRHATAEVEHRLLLLDRAEHVRQRAQTAKPRVIVEEIVFGGVRADRIAAGGSRFVGSRGLCCRRFECGGINGRELAERRLHLLAIAGEIRHDFERRVDRRDGHEIRIAHLVVNVVSGRSCRAIELLGLHRAEIEQQHDQPSSRQLLPTNWRGRRRRGGRCRRPGRQQLRRNGAGLRCSGDFFDIERRDLLRLVVLAHLEVGRSQAADDGAGAIAHDDVDDDEVDVGAKDRPLRLLRGGCGNQERDEEQNCEGVRPLPISAHQNLNLTPS